MLETIVATLQTHGYAILFGIVFLESTGLPLPGESLVMASGMLAGEGSLDIVHVLAAAWLGALLGDNLGYVIGRRYGRAAVVRWGSRVGLGARRFALVEEKFERYGIAIVLVARFIIILRQLNGFVAGTMRMPWWTFLAYNAIGAALWVGGYGLGAYLFGSVFRHFFEGESTWMLIAIAAGTALAGCIGTYRFLLHDKDEKADPE